MTLHNDNHVVIMAGGIGSRFWPMSTKSYPKQFIDVLGTGRTMIQMTVDRFAPICPMDHIWVVTSADYVAIVKEQLPQIPEGNILAEPAMRSTAPCIAYACWKIRARFPQANVVVTPSDALVLNVPEYQRVIRLALDYTAQSDAIVTVGIKPSRPETGYGYIYSLIGGDEVRNVLAFKEKPDVETARAYLSDGRYLWNAGIFVWNVDTITDALRTHAPQIAGVADAMSHAFYTADEQKVVGELFPTCDKISIDYAVMEKASNVHTIPADFGWSDLGTWGSLRQALQKDCNGNAVVGDNVRLFDSEGCVVHVSSLREVVIQGLEDCIVTEKDGALLICRLDEEQRIREFHD